MTVSNDMLKEFVQEKIAENYRRFSYLAADHKATRDLFFYSTGFTKCLKVENRDLFFVLISASDQKERHIDIVFVREGEKPIRKFNHGLNLTLPLFVNQKQVVPIGGSGNGFQAAVCALTKIYLPYGPYDHTDWMRVMVMRSKGFRLLGDGVSGTMFQTAKKFWVFQSKKKNKSQVFLLRGLIEDGVENHLFKRPTFAVLLVFHCVQFLQNTDMIKNVWIENLQALYLQKWKESLDNSSFFSSLGFFMSEVPFIEVQATLTVLGFLQAFQAEDQAVRFTINEKKPYLIWKDPQKKKGVEEGYLQVEFDLEKSLKCLEEVFSDPKYKKIRSGIIRFFLNWAPLLSNKSFERDVVLETLQKCGLSVEKLENLTDNLMCQKSPFLLFLGVVFSANEHHLTISNRKVFSILKGIIDLSREKVAKACAQSACKAVAQAFLQDQSESFTLNALLLGLLKLPSQEVQEGVFEAYSCLDDSQKDRHLLEALFSVYVNSNPILALRMPFIHKLRKSC